MASMDRWARTVCTRRLVPPIRCAVCPFAATAPCSSFVCIAACTPPTTPVHRTTTPYRVHPTHLPERRWARRMVGTHAGLHYPLRLIYFVAVTLDYAPLISHTHARGMNSLRRTVAFCCLLTLNRFRLRTHFLPVATYNMVLPAYSFS